MENSTWSPSTHCSPPPPSQSEKTIDPSGRTVNVADDQSSAADVQCQIILLKERVAHGDALVAAVRTIVSGGTVVDPAIVAMLVSSTSRATMLDRLTQREREVLRLMAEGSSNLGIADHLHVSVKTVETHVAHVFEKLGIEPSPTEHRRVLAVLELLRSST